MSRLSRGGEAPRVQRPIFGQSRTVRTSCGDLNESVGSRPIPRSIVIVGLTNSSSLSLNELNIPRSRNHRS